MNKPLKVLLCIVVVVALLGALTFAIYKRIRPYDPEDFIGLTSAEIVEKYGEFDAQRAYSGKNNLYYKGACGYIVAEAQVGFLGTEPPKYFMIYFDENGIAYKCADETGGWGG